MDHHILTQHTTLHTQDLLLKKQTFTERPGRGTAGRCGGRKEWARMRSSRGNGDQLYCPGTRLALPPTRRPPQQLTFSHKDKESHCVSCWGQAVGTSQTQIVKAKGLGRASRPSLDTQLSTLNSRLSHFLPVNPATLPCVFHTEQISPDYSICPPRTLCSYYFKTVA